MNFIFDRLIVGLFGCCGASTLFLCSVPCVISASVCYSVPVFHSVGVLAKQEKLGGGSQQGLEALLRKPCYSVPFLLSDYWDVDFVIN